MINKVILIGNLGSDVNMHSLSDGRQVGSVSLATTETWRDREGERRKHTEWHRLTFFGRNAEIAGQYLSKGSKIYVEGQLRTNTYEDREGNEKRSTEVRVNRFVMLDSRERGGDGDNWESSSSSKSSSSKSTATHDDGGALDDMHEDIPW